MSDVVGEDAGGKSRGVFAAASAGSARRAAGSIGAKDGGRRLRRSPRSPVDYRKALPANPITHDVNKRLLTHNGSDHMIRSRQNLYFRS